MIKSLESIHVFQIIFFRSVITSLFCIIYLRRRRISLLGQKRGLLFLRAISGIITMTLFFITLQRIPFGASMTLKYLSPVFTAIFAVWLLREKVYPMQAVFFLAAVTGVFLLKGFDLRIDTLSLILGVTGAVFGGLVYVIIRYIGGSEHPMVIINYFMFTAAVLSGLGMLPFWKTPNYGEWPLLLCIGVLGYFGQVFLTKAFQAELASRIAPIKYMEVVYALVIGWAWFGETYNLWGLLGMILIIASMLLNLLYRSRLSGTQS